MLARSINNLTFFIMLPLVLCIMSDRALAQDCHDTERFCRELSFLPEAAGVDLVVAGDHAFVAAYEAGLLVIDISRAEQPQICAALPLAGRAVSLALDGNHLYVAAEEGGLHIVDVQDPSQPSYLGGLDMEGSVTHVDAEGDVACMSLGSGSRPIWLVDVTDPSEPIQCAYICQQRTWSTSFHTFAVTGNLLLLPDSRYGPGWWDVDTYLLVYDITDPTSPHLVQEAYICPGFISRSYLWEDTLYIYSARGVPHFTLQYCSIVDVSDPTQPELTSHWQNDTRSLFARDDDRFAWTGSQYLCIRDESNGEYIEHPLHSYFINALALANGLGYVLLAEGFSVVDLWFGEAAVPSTPFKTSFGSWPGLCRDVYESAFQNRDRILAYRAPTLVMSSRNDLAFFDLRGDSIVGTGALSLPYAGHDIDALDFAGPALFACASHENETDPEARLHLVDCDPPAYMTLLASLDLTAPSKDLLVLDSRIYVAMGSDELFCAEIIDPGDLHLIAPLQTPCGVNALARYGRHLVAAGEGLCIFDLTDPAAPLLLANLPLDIVVKEMAVMDHVLCLTGDDTLQTWHLGDINAPLMLGSCQAPGGLGTSLTLSPAHAYTQDETRLNCFEIPPDGPPVWLGPFNVPGHHGLIAIDDWLLLRGTTSTWMDGPYGHCRYAPLYCADIVPVLVEDFSLAIIEDGVEISWRLNDPTGTELLLQVERDGRIRELPFMETAPGRFLAIDGEVQAVGEGERIYSLFIVTPGTGDMILLHEDSILVEGVPVKVAFEAWPNPFNARTSLSFTLAEPGEVHISIYDVRGRRVWAHEIAALSAGKQIIDWDGRDTKGHELPSGVYLARLLAANGRGQVRLVLIQ